MRDLYFSFFMFTADLRPNDRAYSSVIAAHMRELTEMGYAGFDLPIAPTGGDPAADVSRYAHFRHALEDEGLGDVGITTNVAATRACDPSSEDPATRDAALAYLTSRVDITAALGGTIMAGPIVCPYGAYPTTEWSQTIWSDALQAWAETRADRARAVLERVAAHAEARGVKLAIEPVDHWETAPPNLVSEVMRVLEPIASRRIGLCVDSAHVALGSDGPVAYAAQMEALAAARRLHYIHISAPDRGAVGGSWIDWDRFLPPVLAHYDGPLLVEVFNAIPAFLDGLRLTRRKFWIPGEDAPRPGLPSAYDVARDALAAVRGEIARLTSPYPKRLVR